MSLTYKVNAYFAMLLITIAGAGASLIIIHVAYNNAFAATFVSTEEPFIPIFQSGTGSHNQAYKASTR